MFLPGALPVYQVRVGRPRCRLFDLRYFDQAMVKTWIVVAHQAGAPEGEIDTDRPGRSFRKVRAV
jgi:hypothetical protein